MVSRNWQAVVIAAVVLVTAGAVHFCLFWNPYKLPSTAQVLTDEELKHILGGHGELIEEQIECTCCECCKIDPGLYMHISAARGTVYTDVPVCTVYSAEGATIDFRLHYDSSKADGTIARRQTVLGYGWTHNYNIYLVVRSKDVFMPDGTGRMTRFRKRLDGSYSPSDGITDGLTSIDPNTFVLYRVDGTELTFKLIGPAPWPTSGTMYPLARIEDARGNATAFSYNEEGLLDSITDPYGREVTLTYNGHGRIETVTNVDGMVTQIEYENDDDDLWRITDPLGNTLEYTYDSQNRMTTEKLKDGNTWTCVYNADGKPYQLIDGDGEAYSTVTNPLNWAIDIDHLLQFDEARYIPGTATVTDGELNVTYYEYDENGCIISGCAQNGSCTHCEMGDDLRPVTRTDEEGNQWQYEYDEHGNRTKITDPLFNETQMFYEYSNVPSLPTKQIEPDGDVWEYEYNAKGNLIREIDPIVESPNDRVITHTYDANGHRIGTTDRNGNLTRWEYNTDGTLKREIADPCGLDMITEYEYNSVGRITRKTIYRGPGLNDPVVTNYEYNAVGQLIRNTVDPCGMNLTTEYEYNGNGKIISEKDPLGVTTQYKYDVKGNLVKSVQDPCGLNLTTEFEYDNAGNQTKVIDPRGNETIYEHDEHNQLVKIIDAWDYWTLYEYDERGNQTRESRSIEPNGPPYRVIEYRYDELGRRTHKIIDPCGLNLITCFEYTPPGGSGCGCTGTPGSSLIHKKTDAAGKVIYYYYDQLDQLTKEVQKVNDTNDNDGDSDDSIAIYEYDYQGNQTRIIIKNAPYPDLLMIYEYDAAGRLVREIQGPNDTNSVTEYEYDNQGNVLKIYTPKSNTFSMLYDKAGRLKEQSDLYGTIELYEYDNNGNVLSQTDGLGHSWQYEYDSLGRRIKHYDPLIESPNDKYRNYEYDKNGNLIRETDNEGGITEYTYNSLNRLIEKTIDPCGCDVNIVYEYDGHGNMVRITDDNSNSTAYEYDAAGRLIREVYADDTDTLYSYDDGGNIISRTDAMGNVTTYSYDDLNRLVTRAFANGITDTMTYDRAGDLLSADNNHSHIGYAYDDIGRIINSTQTDLPQTYSYTVAYDYNTVDNTRTITYPDGKKVFEVYDLRYRLAEVWEDGIKTSWYTYDNPSNRVLSKNFNNGTKAQYAYNDNDWITELKHIAPDGNSIFSGFAHTYDAVGNRLDANNLQNVLPYDNARPVTQSEKYTYDAMYRLIDFKRGQWVGGDIPSPTRIRSWQLDGVHNWTRFFIDGREYQNSVNQMNEYDDPSTDGLPPVPDDDGLPDDFMVDPNILLVDLNGDSKINISDYALFAFFWLNDDCNEPDWCNGADLDHDGFVSYSDLQLITLAWLQQAGYNFAHDKNGNLVDDGRNEYYYDYQTAMTSSQRSENLLTGVRDKDTGQMLGQYWYDALGRRIRKLAGGISTVYICTYNWRTIEEYEEGIPTRRYTYGNWIDEVLTMDRVTQGDRFYYHTNVLNSIIALSDDAGTPAERYAYDAYGTPLFSDGSGNLLSQSAVANSYLFTGRRYDTESSLYYYRTRYLDPITGRFMTLDRLGTWWDKLNFGNARAYVASDPVSLRDPFGLNAKGKLNKLRILIDKLKRVKDWEEKTTDKVKLVKEAGEVIKAIMDNECEDESVKAVKMIAEGLDAISQAELPGLLKITGPYFKYLSEGIESALKGIALIEENLYQQYKNIRDTEKDDLNVEVESAFRVRRAEKFKRKYDTIKLLKKIGYKEGWQYGKRYGYLWGEYPVRRRVLRGPSESIPLTKWEDL